MKQIINNSSQKISIKNDIIINQFVKKEYDELGCPFFC